MINASLSELIASVRFPSLLLPLSDGVYEGPACQIERLANVAAVLAARPSPNIARSEALVAASNRAHAVARIFPELRSWERPHWAVVEITSVMEAIEICRSDVSFPSVLDALLYEAQQTVDALAHVDDRADAA